MNHVVYDYFWAIFKNIMENISKYFILPAISDRFSPSNHKIKTDGSTAFCKNCTL